MDQTPQNLWKIEQDRERDSVLHKERERGEGREREKERERE